MFRVIMVFKVNTETEIYNLEVLGSKYCYFWIANFFSNTRFNKKYFWNYINQKLNVLN